VQDEILTNLAKIADLKVISRTSVMPYKSGVARNLREIAQQLGVTHVVEGSVQRAGGKVRVNAQLIDARTDAHLWANTYDRDLADVFAIQSEMAESIAAQLHAKLSPNEKSAIEKPPTADLAAYELYMRAQALYADTSDQLRAAEKLPQAARLLDEAVARDPHFLLAWCRLSRVHGLMYWQGHDHTPARLQLANSAVQTALRLQPEAGEAHLALADYYYHGFRDYDRAQDELAIARRTLPNNAEIFEYTAYINRRQGHWEEATRNLERALELDPRNFYTLQQMALTYEAQRRYADQIRIYSGALTVVPGDPATRIYRAEAELEWRADIKPFQNTLATLIAENPSVASDVDDPRYALCERSAEAMARTLTNYPKDGVVSNGIKYPHAYWEGVAARVQGDTAKAEAAFTAARVEVASILQNQPDFAPALSLLGSIDAALGRKEEALREGRRACELLPIAKDAIDGVAMAVNLAQIYTWTNERDLAIEQIAAVERVPNYLSYGFLKLQPLWDSLRGDARFEQIVASLAPKTAP
jgi:tetratricopeptide (TPR) repeat protein